MMMQLWGSYHAVKTDQINRFNILETFDGPTF